MFDALFLVVYDSGICNYVTQPGIATSGVLNLYSSQMLMETAYPRIAVHVKGHTGSLGARPPLDNPDEAGVGF